MANENRFIPVSTQNKELAGLKMIQATYKCYVEHMVVAADPNKEFVLREKGTNKEIDVYQFAGRIAGQQVRVMKNAVEMQKLTEFLRTITSDPDIGADLMNRDAKVCVRVNGMYMSEDEKTIALINPVFAV